MKINRKEVVSLLFLLTAILFAGNALLLFLSALGIGELSLLFVGEIESSFLGGVSVMSVIISLIFSGLAYYYFTLKDKSYEQMQASKHIILVLSIVLFLFYPSLALVSLLQGLAYIVMTDSTEFLVDKDYDYSEDEIDEITSPPSMTLKEAHQLKEDGIITEEQYEKIRKETLGF